MQMIIGGKYVDSSDKATIAVVNPATQEIIDTVPFATEEDINLAVQNAKEGLKEWSATPLYKRIECMYRFADLIEKKENFDKLVEYEITENGKPITMAEEDIHCSAYIVRAFTEKARNFTGDMIPADCEPGTKDDLILTVREPIGIVVNIIPFNYPTNLYCFKTAPALLMGNAVIVKPASDTPLANIFVTSLLIEAGVPANAIQILTGRGSMGDQLVSHPDIDFVSITGGCDKGKSIMKRCAENLHQCHMELGGNDPMIIFSDCDMDKCIKEVIGGRIGNAGQTCCASKRYIVENSVRPEFVRRLAEALKQVKIGDLRDYSTDMGPVISEKAALKVEEQILHTINQGATLVCGGHRFNHAFIEPTILDNVTADMDVAHDMEIFGPVFPVIGFDTIDEAIELANDIPYGLQSAVMTEDIKKALYVAKRINAGGCIINSSSNYRHNHQAFGGHKKSGFGHEGVAYTLAEMSNTKTIAIKKIFE